MRRIHTFVVGASAGGIEALRALVAQLPADFPGVVVVVLHLAPSGTSVLPQILERAGELAATQAQDGGALEGGRIYVAPPDFHVLVEDGRIRLDHGPRVNGHRPAVDSLFSSAARAYGPDVAGIVLSGVLDDGSAGLMAIKRAGGVTLAQDPNDALYDSMPRHAIDLVHPDEVGTAAELGAAIARLAVEPPRHTPAAKLADPQADAVIAVDRGASDDPQPGRTTGLTCPACSGAIWESLDDGVLRFRCRIGHEYGVETFLSEQSDRVEAALWTALRSLEERAAVHRRIAARNRDRGNAKTAERFALRADDAIEQAIVLRGLLSHYENGALDEEGAA